MLEKEKKKKRNKEISKVMVFGSNTAWVIGVILKISLIKNSAFVIGGFLVQKPDG